MNKYCQLGALTTILPNVEIGEGTVTGACSLVLNSLDSWSIYAGMPVKKIKNREKEILKEANRHIFRTRKNMIKRLRKKSIINPFPPLGTWSEKEIDRGIDEMVYSLYIKTKGDITVLTKIGKKRLLQLQT